VAEFKFDSAQRWARFDPRKSLARRPDDELPFANEAQLGGAPLLLDTCVYIDQMQGRTPDLVEQLIETRQIYHSTIAIQELMHTVGVLDPDDPRSIKVIAVIRAVINSMPPHRTIAPDADTLGRAALVSGILCRLQGYANDRRLRALHDCVLFLQSLKFGFTVLTANISDFDLLLQLLPVGRALFYRQVDRP
jgi:predicted nucleic acid-binding protein